MTVKEAIDVLERSCDFHYEETDKCYGCLFENSGWCDEDFHDSLLALLKEQEAENGEWITIWREDDPDTSTHARCSICNRISERPLGGYCKWCGAKMNQEWGVDGCRPRNTYSTTPSGKVIPHIFCGKCNKEIYAIYTFCPFCGQAVKWE